MKPVHISKNEAKNFVLEAQLLHGNTAKEEGKQAVRSSIEKLGYIQIDTISVMLEKLVQFKIVIPQRY